MKAFDEYSHFFARIREKKPDAVFAWDDPSDSAGGDIAVTAAVVARSTYASENWLIVVTTDHGGIGRGHAGQSQEERTIFMIASGGSVRAGETVSPGSGHTAVPPTVMKHLGLSSDPQWAWESAPFGL